MNSTHLQSHDTHKQLQKVSADLGVVDEATKMELLHRKGKEIYFPSLSVCRTVDNVDHSMFFSCSLYANSSISITSTDDVYYFINLHHVRLLTIMLT